MRRARPRRGDRAPLWRPRSPRGSRTTGSAPRHRKQHPAARRVRRRPPLHAAGAGRWVAAARRRLRRAGLAGRAAARPGPVAGDRPDRRRGDRLERGDDALDAREDPGRARRGRRARRPARALPRRRRAPGRTGGGADLAAGLHAGARGPARRGDDPGAGPGARARRGRVRSPHVPVRAVGLGQDLRARRAARAAAAGHEPADRRAGPELRLRAPARAARRDRA